MLEKYPTQVKIVEKNFPLQMHKFARQAATAALAAHKQGKFWEYHKKLFESISSLNDAKVQEIATQLGLDMETFNASLLGAKYYARVKQDDQECRELGITGTPVFFINGTRLDGARSLKDFQEIMDPILEGSGS